jgi:hypothetical protein
MSARSSGSSPWRTLFLAGALAAAITALEAVPLAAQQTGTVTGKVVDAQSGAPVASAQVLITGTTIGAAVDNDGNFRLTGVPVTAKQIRARSIGYEPRTISFTLTS